MITLQCVVENQARVCDFPGCNSESTPATPAPCRKCILHASLLLRYFWWALAVIRGWNRQLTMEVFRRALSNSFVVPFGARLGGRHMSTTHPHSKPETTTR